ncbi:MAG TPA: hypothetical protein VJ792_09575 [Candidatus Nitrosotalea sp.]|nr:hypothetical protein [Candidatus Nitrosotalea sp.]
MNLTGNLNINDTQITSTSNLLLSLLVTLAESILPILVGAAVGHKSINHWLEKKYNLAKKNALLENYSQSLKKHSALLDNFVNEVFRSYIVFRKEDGLQAAEIGEYSSPEQSISGFLRFPSIPGELPWKKFNEEYKRLSSGLEEVSLARERLYLDLRYFLDRGNNMVDKVQSITKKMSESELVIARLLQSTNGGELLEFYKKYRALSGEIRSETGIFELELIHLQT